MLCGWESARGKRIPMAFALIAVFLFAFAAVFPGVKGNSEPWLKSEKQAELGTDVLLPCVLKSPQCEGLHSIKWYNGATRILIFSEELHGITRGNNDIATRAGIEYTTNSTKTYLKIPSVKLEDEGLYKCEATYLAVNRECNNVQHIILNVTVQPASVRVIDENTKTTVSTGGTLGPINEGSVISLYCESGEGKPVPTVEWYKGDKLLQATSTSKVTDEGIGTGSSSLNMEVTREDLNATLTCKVNNTALKEPLTVDVKLDVHVRPLKMDLHGVVGHVVQGTKILLQCVVSAARPAANVTWYNGTEILNESNDRFEMFETKVNENNDSTSQTTSYLAFTASEFDNGKTFSCYAENSVTRSEDPKPMKEATTIVVLYPPMVTMSPGNITVNETEEFVILCDYYANPAALTEVKWFRGDEEIDVSDDHYEGGVIGEATLTVKNATPNDMGSYKCILKNQVGPSTSEDNVEVSVLYKPVVEVVMEPETPVNEVDRLNVSLTCEVISGNPLMLIAVRWYLDGDLLKELPDCSRDATTTSTTEESLTFCDIDPSKLLLEAVGRSFHGNYSCEGRNEAGWGTMSPSTPVTVYYKPGPASIVYEPSQVVKKRPLKITCSVADPGRPKVSGFKWFRGVDRLPDENRTELIIDSVNLETEANFTCVAYNEAGDGDPAVVSIDVSAPPAFIKKLQPYHGYAYTADNISMMCWIECAPACNISWLKNGKPLDVTKTNRYYVSNVHLPPDPRTNDFESIQSTLMWNLTAWPGGQIDRAEDNAKFVCESSSNGIGAGVTSYTYFHVEFPPDNMTISKSWVDVKENQIPETVICDATALPDATFKWFREGSTDIIAVGRVLSLKESVPRRSNGTYYCEAENRHGTKNISFVLNVQFKPECHVERERIDGEEYIVCSAEASPKETDFLWSLKSDNDTLEQVAEVRNGKSYLLLDSSVSNFRTYVCVAKNIVGESNSCEHDVPGKVPWYHIFKLSDGNLLLIVIIAAVIIVLVFILICVAIFIVFRRKRSQMKYSNRVVELEEREHPDGGPPSPTASSHSVQNPTPAPRWPLKPGVLVHINRTHSLRSGLSIRTNESLRNELMAKRSNDRLADRFLSESEITRPTARVFRRRKDVAAQGAISISSLHEEGMLARANKIKAMFGVQLKEQGTLPGISREKTAVTYKRITPRQRILHGPTTVCNEIPGNISRKRKKPGADPNQSGNNNHVDSVSEGLPDSGTKTFYENLPFHGIQSPPNKLVHPKFARVSALHGTLHRSDTGSACSSRPPSRATSLCDGSSGYESTRSHLGPHYSLYNMPRSNSPAPKCNTLKPRRRKHKHSQFYSLRLCRRHENAHRKYELYAIPIYKSCPHKAASTTTIATIVRSIDDTSSFTSSHGASLTYSQPTSLTLSQSSTSTRLPSPTPPIPAPRARRKTDPTKHTYQNIPTPVFPQTDASCPSSKTDSLYNYKEHYQQHRQEMQQYSYPIPSNSSSQLTLPLTRSFYHSSIVSPLQTSYVHTNNHPATVMHQDGPNHHLPLVHRDDDQQDYNYESRQTRRYTTGRRNERNRKYRKHDRGERKQKQRRSESRRNDPLTTPSCETSFHQIQELGIPDTYKISYPHYYEDSIAGCPVDYRRSNPSSRQQTWERQSSQCADDSLHYTDPGDTKNRNKVKKVPSNQTEDRSTSAPTIMQYADLHFRDIGQEIDV